LISILPVAGGAHRPQATRPAWRRLSCEHVKPAKSEGQGIACLPGSVV
jgi:hypothetical protein